MSNGRLDEPVYAFPEQLTLLGFEQYVAETEALTAEEVNRRSASALAALSALRVRSVNKDTGEVKDVEPRWMELYRRLRDEGWPWRVAVYIAWAAQPRKYRWPETQEELAQKCMGLTSDRVIATWRKRSEGAIDAVISTLQGSIIFEHLPDAYAAMAEVATDPDYKGHPDRKLLFEMAGVYTPSSKLTAEMVKKLVNSKPDDLENLSDDELRSIERTVHQTLDDRQGEADA